MKFSELRGERKATQKKAWRLCQQKHRLADYQHERLGTTTFDELLARRKLINEEYRATLNQIKGR